MTTAPTLHAPGPVGRVLICGDSSFAAGQWTSLLERLGYEAATVDSTELAYDECCRDEFDVCLLGEGVSLSAVAELEQRLQSAELPTQLVCLLPADSPTGPLEGAAPTCCVVPNSIAPAALQTVVRAAVERAQLVLENRRLKRQLSNRALREIVGNSKAMQLLRQQMQQAADDLRPVLIVGEPGAGKNLVAHGIHDASRRAYRPFVRLDCQLLSSECLERELFGNEQKKGAPPVLDVSKINGGTVFLDHVEGLSLPVQKNLVAALGQQEKRRHASVAGSTLDVRVIASTHADLEALIERGLFRRDLFEHLSQIQIHPPPLRERKQDICLLAEHFLNCQVAKEGKAVRRVTLDALELMEGYDWPGNVRELQNVIDRACSLDFGPRLTADMLRPWLAGTSADDEQFHGMTLKEMERKLIETTFARCDGNRERTAQTLQIGIRTLSGKLREYGYPPRGGPGSKVTSDAEERKAA